MMTGHIDVEWRRPTSRDDAERASEAASEEQDLPYAGSGYSDLRPYAWIAGGSLSLLGLALVAAVTAVAVLVDWGALVDGLTGAAALPYVIAAIPVAILAALAATYLGLSNIDRGYWRGALAERRANPTPYAVNHPDDAAALQAETVEQHVVAKVKRGDLLIHDSGRAAKVVAVYDADGFTRVKWSDTWELESVATTVINDEYCVTGGDVVFQACERERVAA